MITRFYNFNSQNLIIFLAGWGCDDKQFQNMIDNGSGYDILMCWDYTNIDFEPKIDFEKYNDIYLITYSAGVYVAGLIKNKLPKITKSVAVNGSPLMFDKKFGLNQSSLEFMKNLDLSNYMEFRKDYLVSSEEELEFFNTNCSVRSFESCDDELKSLEENYVSNEAYNYDFAILSSNDKIFNPKSQKEYFDGKYILLEGFGHNVFYKYQKFDSILADFGL